MHRARIAILLACALSPLGQACSKRAPAADVLDAALLPSPVAAASPPPRPASDAAVVDVAAWTKVLTDYFDLYTVTGVPSEHEFDALAAHYAPDVVQFITLKNTTPAKVVESAASFFKNKQDVRYQLDPNSVRVSREGDATAVDGTVTMGWNVVPADASADADPADEGGRHEVDVDVRLVFDAQQRITQYLERRVHKRRFRLVQPKHEIFPLSNLPVPYGAVVEDLHEFISVDGPRGPDVRRKVQYEGKAHWLPEVLHMEAAIDPGAGGGPVRYGTLELRYLEPVGENAPSKPQAGWIPPAPLPSGPYQARCSSCRATVTDLQCASCVGIDGAVMTNQKIALPCAATVNNCNGLLTCGDCPSLPAGPYQATCTPCGVRKELLSCTCYSSSGRYGAKPGEPTVPFTAVLPLPCANVIQNCNGHLNCGACPAGSPATTSTVVPPVPHP